MVQRFLIQVAIEGNRARAEAAQIERSLEGVERAAGQASTAAQSSADSAAAAIERQAAAARGLQQAVESSLGSIRQENELLGLNARERGIQERLLREIQAIERQSGGEVSAEDRDRLRLELEKNTALREQTAILDRIRGPQERLEAETRSLNQLLERGAVTNEEYARELDRIQREAAEAGGGLDRLGSRARTLRRVIGTAFAGVSAALLVRESVEAADAFRLVQNRVRTVTETQDELTSSTEELFAIASRTRTGYEATVEIYARLGQSQEELGLSTERLLGFTESLNQAVRLSGAGSAEANNALIQLSQGLASGALRGDELRSVLEQLPIVADVIASSLGVTRGELRALGEDGRLTADVIIGAFDESAESLEQRFSTLTPTVAESLTVLRNNVVEFAGETDQAIGATSVLAAIILNVGENVELYAAGILAAGVTTASVFVPATLTANAALVGTAGGIRAVTVALAANPFALAVAGISAAGIAALEFSTQLEEVQEEILRTTELGERFQLTEFARAGVDVQQTREQLERLNTELNRPNGGGDGRQFLLDQVAALEAQLERELDVQERIADGRADSTVAAREQAQAVQDLAESVDDQLAGLERENELLGLNARQREIQAEVLSRVADLERGSEANVTDDDRRELELALERNRALREQAEVLERIRGPQADFDAQITALNGLLAQGRIEQEEFNAELARLTESADLLDLSEVGLDDFVAGLEAIDPDRIREIVAAAREAANADTGGGGNADAAESAAEAAARLEREVAAAVAATAAEIQQSNELLGLGNAERRIQAALAQEIARIERDGGEVTAEDEALLENLLRENDALALRASILDEIQGPTENLALLQETLNELLAEGTITLEQYNERLFEAQAAAQSAGAGSAFDGLEAGLSRVRAGLSDVSGAVENELVGAFGDARGVLSDFIRTGEADLEGFFDSIQQRLADLIADQLIALLLNSVFGGGGGTGGGLVGAIGGLFGGARREGGPVNPDQTFLVGEEGPELFTPPNAGDIVPAGETAARLGAAAASSMSPEVNVSVPPAEVVVVDSPDRVPSGLRSREGREAVVEVVGQERDRIRGLIT